MNGIVHPCTHPEGRPPPETEDEMMLEVFKYTDRVVSMARPRKILMIAVDGVAPRAKMNQQRSRRFRSAQDARILAEEKQRAIAEAEARGEIIDEAIKGKKAWDTNVITPGTPFMDILAKSLRYWVAYKLNNDPGWKDVKVIISDASVPGEGEHKIMEFIRSQRSDPAHDPNTSHCIYGLDADLIFLGLATHEPHFKILREDVFAQDSNKRRKNNNAFALTEEEKRREEDEEAVEKAKPKPFIWLHVDILRQYLEIELDVPRLPFVFDIERAIDDWVFMCFFVGNDFLPHMPSLDVRDNGIDILIGIWRRSLPAMKGYMTCDGQVDLSRVQIMMRALGQQEDGIFRKKREGEVRRLRNEKKRRIENDQRRAYMNQMSAPPPVALSKNRGERAPIAPLDSMPLYSTSGESVGKTHMSNSDIVANRNALNLANMANKTAAQELKAKLLLDGIDSGELEKSKAEHIGDEEDAGNKGEVDKEEGDEEDVETQTPNEEDVVVAGQKRKATSQLQKPTTSGSGQGEDEFDEPEDNIKLWEPGYRNRYYSNKFHVSENDTEFRKGVVKKYIEGICWTLLYYYQGCPSWNWYFPYHYAPFAQDLVDLAEIEIKFELGEPFAPFEQLMSVLPADSSHTLPDIFHPLMSDPKSSIIDFYPVDFPIDMNGKKMAWQGVALLPFIDEKRLLTEVQALYPHLTDHERYRNGRRQEVLLISSANKLYKDVKDRLYGESKTSCVEFRSDKGNGLAGLVRRAPGIQPDRPLAFPLNTGDMPSFDPDMSLVMEYSMPELAHYNKSMLLTGVKLIDPVLTYEDKETIRNGPKKNMFHGRNNRNVEYNTVKPHPVSTGIQRSGGYKYFVSNGTSDQRDQHGYGSGSRNGYGQGGYNSSSYNGGGYGAHGGYGRGGYNQGVYGHDRYSQGGYGQGGYGNNGYNNGGYGQSGYGQTGNSQSGYGSGYGYGYGYDRAASQGGSGGYGYGRDNNRNGYNDNRYGYNQGRSQPHGRY
ncbi:ssRNA exonuclease RAT1 [Sugiyamaella lignohabitans]|uniref:5'-3' exoribonuclease n=1 Tax=Sugiyamaella lignohabitans TaxID=796027 RepID=A0A167EJM5_9ASCO|nr:ssRNA exonuclease RAT1 [Sugiyamaella lignohabitans]ANB14155.1 ssRNA exonuclease RAT1 [Sugiyamaella lignohabitans]